MLKYYDTYKIPVWAVCYLANGVRDNLSDEQERIIEDWHKETFPKGCTFDFGGEDNEPYFSTIPAFGERNSHALTNRGEPPFLACNVLDVKAYVDDGRPVPPVSKASSLQLLQFHAFLTDAYKFGDDLIGEIKLKRGYVLKFDLDGFELYDCDNNAVFTVLANGIGEVVDFLKGLSVCYVEEYEYKNEQ